MSYSNHNMRYSMYQPVVPVHQGLNGGLNGGLGGGLRGPQGHGGYGRRSLSVGSLYQTAAPASQAPSKTPRFSEAGFMPGAQSSTSTTTTAAVPDRYHRQRNASAMSTVSLPSLSNSSDLDSTSTQTSASSQSSWGQDEKDRFKRSLPTVAEPPARVPVSVSSPNLVVRKQRDSSQRTANEAVEEALASLSARGEQPPSSEPVLTHHRRRSSADSRTSLVLPSERRRSVVTVGGLDTPQSSNVLATRRGSAQLHRRTASGNSVGSGSAPPSLSAKQGPVLRKVPGGSAPTSAATAPAAARSTNGSPAPSTANSAANSPIKSTNLGGPTGRSASTPSSQPITAPANNRLHSRSPSMISMTSQVQPTFAPIRLEEKKPRFSQKIKSLFRKSHTSDSASISSGKSGFSITSGLSQMSTRSTSSTFSFQSIRSSSKRFFGKKEKPVDPPTFEAADAGVYGPAPSSNSSSSSRMGPRGPNATSLSSMRAPPSAREPAGPAPGGRTSPVAVKSKTAPMLVVHPAQGQFGSPEMLDVPDTVFPRSLDDADAQAIRHSVERVASVDRKGSVRSVRSLHKPNDDEKVPNAHEVRVESPDEDDLFGELDLAPALDLTLPKHLKKKRLSFASQVMIFDTFACSDYDRHPEPATCNRLTPALAQQIKDELNELKMSMEIHPDSRAFTQFF